jgi:hypothetical protein
MELVGPNEKVLRLWPGVVENMAGLTEQPLVQRMSAKE